MRAAETDRIGDGVGGGEELVAVASSKEHPVSGPKQRDDDGRVKLSPFDFPRGTIAIPQGERIRYPSFAHCLSTTSVPPGTQIAMMTSVSLVENLNTIVRNREGEWTWFQSDEIGRASCRERV